MRSVMITSLTALLLGACTQFNEVVEKQEPRISLTVSNLPPLAADEGHYQLWATFLDFNKSSATDSPTHTEGFLSLGEFTLIQGEGVRGLDGNAARFQIPQGENVQLLDDIILTIQRKRSPQDTSEIEPGSAVIGGKFRGDGSLAVADLTIQYTDAFKSDFATVTGVYTITAPTSSVDSNSGVWFYEPNPTPSRGLRNLPVLPPSWRYEGWVVDMTDSARVAYYSTGKFLRADSSDFDGAGPGSGSGTPLNFPGQDFITATGTTPAKPNLRSNSFRFMITLEPHPDNSTKPSMLVLLISPQVLAVPGTPLVQSSPMVNVRTSFLPHGKVTVVR